MNTQPTWKRQLRRENWIRLGAFAASFILFVVLLLKIQNLMTSVVLAVVLVYLLGPMVQMAEHKGLQRITAISVIYLVLTALLALLGASGYPLVASQYELLRDELPKYINGMTDFFTQLESRFYFLSGDAGFFDLSDRAEELIITFTSSFFEDIPNLLSRSLTTLFLAPLFAFFLLKDGRTLKRAVISFVPNQLFETVHNLQFQVNRQVGGFVRARLLGALIVGLVTLTGLLIIDFRYAPLLAAFAAVTNLIPYVGPIIGAVPALAIALINGSSGLEITAVAVVYLIAQLLDALILIPIMVAKLVNMHPVTVVVVLIAGAQLMGVLGMIISIPVYNAGKLTVSAIYQHLVDFRV